MAEKKTYTVHRAMHGDGRDYARGDTRQLTEADAAPLVQSGALALKGEVPMERREPVLHTFGALGSDDLAVTTAEAPGLPQSLVASTDVADSRVEGRRQPRKG